DRSRRICQRRLTRDQRRRNQLMVNRGGEDKSPLTDYRRVIACELCFGGQFSSTAFFVPHPSTDFALLKCALSSSSANSGGQRSLGASFCAGLWNPVRLKFLARGRAPDLAYVHVLRLDEGEDDCRCCRLL